MNCVRLLTTVAVLLLFHTNLFYGDDSVQEAAAAVHADVAGVVQLRPDIVVSYATSPPADVVLELHELQPNSYYEVRISYPAYEPVDITMRWSSAVQAGARSLLNIEKIMFQTDSMGRVTDLVESDARPPPQVAVHFAVGGVQLLPITKYTVHCDIVLETLFYGMPYPVFGLAALIAVLLFLAFKYIYPYAIRVVTQQQHPSNKLQRD